jgi:porin
MLVAPAGAVWGQATTTQPAAQTKTADESGAKPAPPKQWPFNLGTSPTLTGDWGGVRTKLKDTGFSFSPVLYSGYMQNYRGGDVTHHGHELPRGVQYNTEFDFAKAQLIPGASFFMRGVQGWNDGCKGAVGSMSFRPYGWGSTGDHEILVDKWWWRQRLLNDRIEIRVGKLLNVIDLFDANAYAGNNYGQFTNSYLTTNPTIPSTKGLGAFVRAWPVDWFYVETGAMDPDQRLTRTGFDTAFHGEDHFRAFWEFGFTPKWETARGKLPGNYRFGWWYDPQRKTKYDRIRYTGQPADVETGDVGAYMNFDQLVWKEQVNPKDKQGLGVFARYGFAQGDRNKVEHFWSCGTQYEGLIPTRDRDVLGFGVAQAILSEQYHEHVKNTSDRETVYELYYLIEVTPWMVITPDLQFITNPGGDRFARDSIVGGVRVKIAL